MSLVAFDFLDTRVLGIPWPGFRNFPEVNLRMYVRQRADRGVQFVREFVPSRLVAWLARMLYNEPYRAAPMESHACRQANRLTIEHRVFCAGRWQSIKATGKGPPYRPDESSVEHFFKEHRWGFGVSRKGRTLRYEVRHPVWDIVPVHSFELDLEWAKVYGPEWSFLGQVTPFSTILAIGSSVAVFPHGRS